MLKEIQLPHGAKMTLRCDFCANPKDNEGCAFELIIDQFGKQTILYLTYNSVERMIKSFRSGLNEAEDDYNELLEERRREQEADDIMYSDARYDEAKDDSIMALAGQMKSLCEEIKA